MFHLQISIMIPLIIYLIVIESGYTAFSAVKIRKFQEYHNPKNVCFLRRSFNIAQMNPAYPVKIRQQAVLPQDRCGTVPLTRPGCLFQKSAALSSFCINPVCRFFLCFNKFFRNFFILFQKITGRDIIRIGIQPQIIQFQQ